MTLSGITNASETCLSSKLNSSFNFLHFFFWFFIFLLYKVEILSQNLKFFKSKITFKLGILQRSFNGSDWLLPVHVIKLEFFKFASQTTFKDAIFDVS